VEPASPAAKAAKVEEVPPAATGGTEIVAQIQPRIEPRQGSTPRSAFARAAPLPGSLIMLLDLNNDGLISDAETRQTAVVFQKRAAVNGSQNGGRAILDAFDKDGNGRLDRAEALHGAAVARMHVEGSGKAVASLMGALDADADGMVSGWEFRALVDKLGRMGPAAEPRLAQLFAGLDANQDGMISVVESQMVAGAFVRESRMEIQAIGPGGQQLLGQPIVPKVRTTIAQLDRNRDGKISVREARKDGQLQKVFENVDQDGDSQLTGGEIYDYVRQRLSPQSPPSSIRIKLSVPRPKPARRP
jgi:Ca2+-binding EF-hand superfamily protein